MKRLLSLFAIAALSATAFGQTVQQLRSQVSLHSATFTSGSGTAYTAGDSVGTVQVLTNIASAGRIITLDSITVKDSANQKKAGYILFFSGSAPTLVDNTAFAFGASTANLIAIIDLASSDYFTVDSVGLISRSFFGTRMKLLDSSANLSVAFVTADAPTYGNGGTIKIDFHFSN